MAIEFIVGLLSILEEGLDLIVQDEHESATHTTENVRESALEESLRALGLSDLGPAVDGVLVHAFVGGQTRLHHHTSTDSVEGVRDNTRDGGHGLGDQPRNDNWSVLRIGKHALSGIEETEVGSTVDDDTWRRHSELGHVIKGSAFVQLPCTETLKPR